MRADFAPASRQPDAAPACDISVVIPTRNRPTKLHRCLASLSEQTLGRDRFEVIVVNDGGPPLDATLDVWRNRLRLRTINQSHAGPAAARNAGASAAHGALLAFTDDDCEPQPEWLTECVNRLHQAPHQAIGGHTQNALQDNAYSSASQLLIDYLYERHAAVRTRMPAFLTSNNLAVSTEIFNRLGGFDRSFTRAAAEDRDFCERWQEHGYQLAHLPSAVVRHAHSLTLASFWRQHVNYGRGAYTLRRVRAARGTQATKPEPLSFYVGLFKYPLRTPSLKSPLLVALLFVSQVANTFGFALERARSTITALRP
jgi:GT2 family glycosyltransferase